MRSLGHLLPLVLALSSGLAAEQIALAPEPNATLVQRAVNGVVTDFVFDLRDQLVEVRQGESVLVRYQYDAEGRMILKIGLEGVRQYVHDGRRVVAEYDGTGRLVACFRWDTNARLNSFSLLAGGVFVAYYPHYDALGSIVALTDENGRVVGHYRYDAWGSFRFPTDLQSTPNRFLFTSHLWQPEIGLYQTGARFLDPSLGRFISADPAPPDLERPATLNAYPYVLNAPTRYTDPLGLWEWDATLGGAADDRQLREAQRSAPTREERSLAKRARQGREAFRAAFEQAVRAKNALPQGDERAAAERALAAYGQEGDAPIETVITSPSGSMRFVQHTVVAAEPPSVVGARGEVVEPEPAPPVQDPVTGEYRVDLQVRVRLHPDALSSGDELPVLQGHEGWHLADRQRLQAAIITEARDGVRAVPAVQDPTINVTRYETERGAYRVSAAIAEGRYRANAQPTSAASATTVVIGRRSQSNQLNYRAGGRDFTLWDASWTEQERARKRDAAIDAFLAVETTGGGLYGVSPTDPGPRLHEVR